MNEQHDFGVILKNLRKKLGMSLRDVSKECGISNSYLSQIERGYRKLPSSSFLIKLSNVYGISKQAMMDIIFKDVVDSVDIERTEYSFFLKKYKKLSDIGKKEVIDFLLFIENKELQKNERTARS